MSSSNNEINVLIDIYNDKDLILKRFVKMQCNTIEIGSFLDNILTQVSDDRKQKFVVVKAYVNNEKIDMNKNDVKCEKIMNNSIALGEDLYFIIYVKKMDDDWELLDQAYNEIKYKETSNVLSPEDFNVNGKPKNPQGAEDVSVEEISAQSDNHKEEEYLSEIKSENNSSHWKDQTTCKDKSEKASQIQDETGNSGSKKQQVPNTSLIEDFLSGILKPVESALENVISMIPEINIEKDTFSSVIDIFKNEAAVKSLQSFLSSDSVTEFFLDICRNEVEDKTTLFEYIKTHLPYFLPQLGKFLQDTPEAMRLLPAVLNFLTTTVLNVPKAKPEKDNKTSRTRSKESFRDSRIEKEMSRVMHFNVECDGCLMYPAFRRKSIERGFNVQRRISGHRYKSAVRENFDLCQSCEASGKFDDGYAPFLKIRHPSKAPKEIFCVLKGENKTPINVKYARKKPRPKVIPKPGSLPQLQMSLLDMRSSRLGTRLNPLCLKENEKFSKEWSVRNTSKQVDWPFVVHLVCSKEYFVIDNERFSTNAFKLDKHLVCPLPILSNGIVKIRSKAKFSRNVVEKMRLISRNQSVVQHISKWRLKTEDNRMFGEELAMYLNIDFLKLSYAC